MDSFQWGEHFLTGVSDVDNQHKHLVDLINELGRSLTEDGILIQDVDDIYNELSEYAVHHFQEEENLMSKIKLDALHLNRHIDVHKGFLDDVISIYSNISQDNLDPASDLLRFLTHWLAYHILGDDQDMAKQIKAIKSGVSPREAYDKLEQERACATAPLLEALNGLFELVTTRNKELKQLNESLEEKIELRTRELSEANRHLEELSLTDVLTGLPNRRHAIRCLSKLWEEALQNDSPLVCMMIDADHFKEVNDTYGHDAGDAVLIELAKTLQHALRSDDTVCRLGGDEFFIICPNTDKEGGMHIAELTRKAVSELRVPTGGEPWHGSISIGVASRSPDMKKIEELMKDADTGVYAAKEAGKNCVKTTN
ncbi:MAG: bacteriohemerythrin [Desulfobacteraceae bacterium]|nr:bacteriohemerythrin [Desulfobacteraceae bacterium]